MKREAFRIVLGAALAVCLIAVPPATAATPYAPQLTRYPYLTDVAGGGATINWATDRSSASAYVTWGVAGVESCTAHSKSASRTQITVGSTPEYQWKARLSLAPDTTYCYRVYLGATGSGLNLLGSNPSPQFATERPAGSTTPFKFAVLGDWGSVTATGNPDQANLMGRLASSGARFALSTGDIAYPGGSQTNYGDLYQTGANVSAVFGPQFWTAPGASMPLFPVLGNHGLNASFPLIWPGASAATASNGRFQIDNYCCLDGTASANYPSVWYAFDSGPARFYMLDAAWANSNLGTGSLYQNDFDNHWTPASPEYQWLESRPSQPFGAGQVRDLPLPALFGQRDRDVGRLPSRSGQSGRSTQPVRSRHRFQRPRPHLRAQQREWPRRPDQLRDRGRRRTPGAGQQVQRPPRHRRLRDRLVEFLGHGQRLRHRLSARLVESGLPLPAGQRQWEHGHRHPDGLAGAHLRQPDLRISIAAPVTDVTVTLSALDAAAADISEFTGIASVLPLDASAGQGNASSIIAPTPSIVTSSGEDVIVGAINYLTSTASTLTSPSPG